MGLVTAEFISGRPKVTLLDLSSDGFAVESAEPLTVGTRHRFCFKAGTGKDFVTSAQVVACLLIDGTTRFKTHFKFSGGDHSTKKTIDQLLDAVTSPLTFY